MITTLVVVCFLAITAYCLVVAWPRLTLSQQTGRRPGGLRNHDERIQRSLYDVDGHKRSTDRPRLLKR